MKKNLLKNFKNLYSNYILSLNSEQRQKILSYLYISLTLFTVSFFGFFAITPTLSTISNLNKQYEDNKLVYDSLNKKLSDLQLLDFQYKEIQPDLELIYSAIPKTAQIPYLTRQIENIIKEDNLSISKLSFNPIEIYPNNNKGQIYAYTFTVAVTGSQETINNFISDIINFDRIVGIDRITTGKDEENKYSASITGRAFFSNK